MLETDEIIRSSLHKEKYEYFTIYMFIVNRLLANYSLTFDEIKLLLPIVH